jgi:hypothetical protein
VRQEKPGPRGRTDYKVTATGKKLLKDGWLALIEDGPSGDIDSDLRVVLLALSGGGGCRLAADFLRRSADKKMESVATTEPIRIQVCCLFCHGGTANCDPQPPRRCSRPNRWPSARWPTLCPGNSRASPGIALVQPRSRRVPDPVSKGSLGVLIYWNV